MNLQPLVGVALLATGRARGLARFESTVPAFLASLAPLIAVPLAVSVLLLLSGRGWEAVTAFSLSVVAQVSPPVVSHWLAVRWGREAEWLRYATAANWCQWALPVAAFVLLVVLQLVGGGRMTVDQATQLLILGLAAYGLWLHWLIARHALALGWGRAAWLVVLVNGATVLLVMLPRVLIRAAD